MTSEWPRSYNERQESARKFENKFSTLDQNETTLSVGLIKAAFEQKPWGQSVDLVGVVECTNPHNILSHLSPTYNQIRVFEPNEKMTSTLALYLIKNGGTLVTNSRHVEITFPNGEQPIDFKIYTDCYEEVVHDLPGTSDITFLDQTLNHATNPVGLLKALIIGDPKRIIGLRGFINHAIAIHAADKKGVNPTQLNDGSGYSRTCPPMNYLLKEGEVSLWRNDNSYVNTYGKAKRVNGKVFKLGKSEQSQVEDRSERFWVAREGTFELPEDFNQDTDTHLFINDKQFSKHKTDPHARKLLVGTYQIGEMLVAASQIDPSRLKAYMPRNFYSSLKHL